MMDLSLKKGVTHGLFVLRKENWKWKN